MGSVDFGRPAERPDGPAGFARRARALTAAASGRARTDGAFDLMAETLKALGYGEGVEILEAAAAHDRANGAEPDGAADTPC